MATAENNIKVEDAPAVKVKLSNILAAYEILEKQMEHNVKAMDCSDDKAALDKARKLMGGK